VLEQSLADLWNFGPACLSVALVPVGLTQFSHLYTGKTMDQPQASALLDVAERWGERARRERGETWVFGSDELYLLAARELPEAAFYGDFDQVENGVGAVATIRARVREGAVDLPRLDGKKIGVVTGVSMAPLMPPLVAQLASATRAHFEIIETTNSLFGPATTTAGLLVGADISRALGHRGDLDFALIPAETINESGVFLDDATLASVRATVPVPFEPSYDFVDVLGAPEALSAMVEAR
jgi:NifB/MoaA-like Fe-S oxidoreductase